MFEFFCPECGAEVEGRTAIVSVHKDGNELSARLYDLKVRHNCD